MLRTLRVFLRQRLIQLLSTLRTMRNLDHHRYIGEAIQLLQNKGEKVKVPFWFKALDWFLAIGYVSGLAFLLYKLITWLLKTLF